MSAVTVQEIIDALSYHFKSALLRNVSMSERHKLIDRIQSEGIAPLDGSKFMGLDVVANPYLPPDGFALVPIEPTDAMIAAIGFDGEIHVALGHATAYMECVEQYKAMLAVAPNPEVKP